MREVKCVRLMYHVQDMIGLCFCMYFMVGTMLGDTLVA